MLLFALHLLLKTDRVGRVESQLPRKSRT